MKTFFKKPNSTANWKLKANDMKYDFNPSLRVYIDKV